MKRKYRTREEENDIEANHFAMCLLMPESIVRPWMSANIPNGLEFGSDHLRVIGKAFGVDEITAAVRLRELGYL